MKNRVIIVGGGFAGVRLANTLDPEEFEVILVDKNNYHQFQPLLYQVASSGLEASSICFSYRKLFNTKQHVTFRMAEVLSVDTKRSTLMTSIGEMAYDYLVLAYGTTTNFFGNDSIKEASLTLKTVEEAMFVRNRLLLNIEKAAVTQDPAERRRLMNIVVVGGGATGVEVAGVFAEMKKFVMHKDYADIKEELNIYLLEGASRLLAAMSEKASDEALKFLKKMGVHVRLNTIAVNYSNGAIVLGDGTELPTSNLIWVSGVVVPQLSGLPSEIYGRGGRIQVNEYGKVKGHENIFAIGDVAISCNSPEYPNGHPQVAQVAIQQAVALANNLLKIKYDKPTTPFLYKNLGSLATIGRNKAVADIWHMHSSGFLAWQIWLLVHLRSILGVKNKIFVLLDWIWNYFSYQHAVRLLIFRGKRE